MVDAYDPEVIANIIDDLPLEHVFMPGKTNMYDGVKPAAEAGKTRPPDRPRCCWSATAIRCRPAEPPAAARRPLRVL